MLGFLWEKHCGRSDIENLLFKEEGHSPFDQQLTEMGVKYFGTGRYSAVFKPAGITDSSSDGGGKLD